ncbi:hypothetical protein ACI5KX_06035 [Erythrobacter sp. GH1-10]
MASRKPRECPALGDILASTLVAKPRKNWHGRYGMDHVPLPDGR